MDASTFSAIGYVHSLKGELIEAVEAFHKALGIRRDDTFSTTMLNNVIEQMTNEEPTFIGTITFQFIGASVFPVELEMKIFPENLK